MVNSRKNISQFQMSGYTCKLYTTCREGKGGGGVALYVKNNICCNIVENMCKNVENYMESVFVELSFKKHPKIYVGCIYRSPNSPIDVFN